MRRKGDTEGAGTWLRIIIAIGELGTVPAVELDNHGRGGLALIPFDDDQRLPSPKDQVVQNGARAATGDDRKWGKDALFCSSSKQRKASVAARSLLFS
jgi:hypothetical protein